jgi:predicted Zn-dependent peptidase
MPQVKSVTALVVVGMGSRYEKEAHQGVSHFIEHMMFKGTKKRPNALAVASELDSIGAQFNAFTGSELTGFYVKSFAKHLSLSLDVLSDILINSKFAADEVERERKVILEERRMYRDNPRDYIHDLYDRLVYGRHPLGRPTIGKEETIHSIGRGDLLDYCRGWYRPGNIVVGIAGGVGGDLSKKEVTRFFGKLGKEAWEKPLPFKSQQKKSAVLLKEKKTDQTHLALGVRGYPLGHPRKYAYAVLNTILGRGMSSRLFTEIREKRGLAYYVGSLTSPYTDAGDLTVFAGVNNRRVKEAVEAIVKELSLLKENPVSKSELSKAKEMLKGTLSLSLESSSAVARFFVGQEILEEKIESPEEVMGGIDEVGVGSVWEVAQEIFVNEGLNLALIGPFKRKDSFLPLLSLS